MRAPTVSLIVSLSAALGACAWQAKEAPKPTPVAAARPSGAVKLASNDPGDPNQMICKREEITGSRLEGSKECHTRAEWAELRAAGVEKLGILGAPGLSPTQTAAQAGNAP